MDLKNDINSYIKKNMGKVEKAVLRVGYNETVHTFSHALKVHFNPSSLHFSTNAGTYQHNVMSPEGTEQSNQTINPPETELSVELVFDNVDIRDAFMFEGVKNPSVMGEIKDKVRSLGGGSGYSLQDEIEGIIGLVTSARTRRVEFDWGELMFAGEVNSINASYTMFNPKGEPIRAKVSLTITEQAPIDKKGKPLKNDLDTRWEKSFDKIFEQRLGSSSQDTMFNPNSKLDAVKNILNF